MSTPRVLIGSPIRQKPAILEAFLSALEALEHPSLDVSYHFVDDNDDPASSALLAAFAARHPGRVRVDIEERLDDNGYVCDATTHRWKRMLVLKVAGFKNRIIQNALAQGYDYLFLADSDLVLHPRLLEHLHALRREIACEIFWTRWKPGSPELPNAWMYDTYTLVPQHYLEVLDDEQRRARERAFLEMLRRPGTYEVGGLGACTLIARSALEKGVNFSLIPNLSFWGEDRFFCVRAAVLGIALFIDTHYPAYHIYRDDDLPGAKAYAAANAGGAS